MWKSAQRRMQVPAHIGAFGLFFKGLVLIVYPIVCVGGSAVETTGYIVSARSFLHGRARPIAVITALLLTITIYSSAFLFAGLLAMTIGVNKSSNTNDCLAVFEVIALVPVSLMALCVVGVFVGCEVLMWVQTSAKQQQQQRQRQVASDEGIDMLGMNRNGKLAETV